MSRDLARIGSLLALHGQGVLEVTYVGGSAWMRAARAYRLLPPLQSTTWEREPQVTAVPLARPGRYLEHVPSALLWARTVSGKQAQALRNFRPVPTVVIREGSRYTAFWALSHALSREGTLKGNRRIAKRLGTPYTACDTAFAFSLPGAVLREGRGRSTPVELVRYEPEILEPLAIVGRLKDPMSDTERAEMIERRRSAAIQSRP